MAITTLTAIAVTGIAVAVTAGSSTASTAAYTPATASPSTTGSTTPSPTPSPTPTVPAVYGDTGLAATIAQEHDHDSMSAACDAGLEWACHITDVEEIAGNWRVTIGKEPYDGNATARTILNQAPKGVSIVGLQCVPHGQTAGKSCGSAMGRNSK